MYKTQLKKLVEVALMDGLITQKERTVLLKKAQSFGLDPEEFDLVLDAIAQAQARNSRVNLNGIAYFDEEIHPNQGFNSQNRETPTSETRAEAPKKNTAQKCPSCNDTLLGLSRVCGSCGFVLSQESNSDLQQHINLLEQCLFELKQRISPRYSYNVHLFLAVIFPFGLYFVWRKMLGKSIFGPELKTINDLVLSADKQVRLTSVVYGEAPEIKKIISDIEAEKTNILNKHKRKRKIRIGIAIASVAFWFIVFIMPDNNSMKAEHLLEKGEIAQAKAVFNQMEKDETGKKHIEALILEAENDQLFQEQINRLIQEKDYNKARTKAAAISNKELQEKLIKKIDTEQSLND